MSLPWKPLSPHRPRDRKHKEPTRQGGREKNSNRQTDRDTDSQTVFQALLQQHLIAFQTLLSSLPPSNPPTIVSFLPWEKHCICTVSGPKKRKSSLKRCLIAVWTFTGLTSTSQSYRSSGHWHGGLWGILEPHLPPFWSPLSLFGSSAGHRFQLQMPGYSSHLKSFPKPLETIFPAAISRV